MMEWKLTSLAKVTPVAGCVVGSILLMSYSAIAGSDDYRWVQYPQDKESQLIPVDPSICKLYEQNLRYFARKNIPMSCSRPIAPQFKSKIKDVDWEDLDPGKYPELLYAIVTKNRNYFIGKSEELIQRDLASIRREIKLGIYAFRRAKLSLAGRLTFGQPNSPIEPYWIVQYGVNRFSVTNPEEVFRCEPRRGGVHFASTPDLYVVSADTMQLIGTIGVTRFPSSEGQHIKLINGKIFVENLFPSGRIELNQVDEAIPMTDTVCKFEFTKSTSRSK